MYAQEFMKSVLLALTSIFNDLINVIGQFRNLEALTPSKSGNILGGFINLIFGALNSLIEVNTRLFPWVMNFGDRALYIVSTNSTANAAYHNISLSKNLPNITGDPNGTYGLTYLINATVNVGADGTSYIGDPTISVNMLIAMYQAIAAVLDLLGEIGSKIPSMFPWG